MEASEIIEAEQVIGLPTPPPLTVGIAINAKRESKHIVRWALEKFLLEKDVVFKLIHVRPVIVSVPTPMGNTIPISQVRDDVAAAYKMEMEWQISQKLLPFKHMCSQRNVHAEIVIVESDDVANAIAEEVAKFSINKLVIGASSRGMFGRKLKDLSSKISVSTPSFCTVYAVSKGKLSSVRPSDSESIGTIKDDVSVRDDVSVTSSSSNSSGYTTSSQTGIIATATMDFSNIYLDFADASSVASYSSFCSPSLPMQRFQALSTINQGLNHKIPSSTEIDHPKFQSIETMEGMDSLTSCPSISETGRPVSPGSSSKSMQTDYQAWSDEASNSDVITEYSSVDSQANINFELQKLRTELRHIQGIYAVAQSETMDASRKLLDLSKRRSEETMKLQEVSSREEKAKELARRETKRYEAAIKEAEHLKEYAERETAEKREAETRAVHVAREKEKIEKLLVGPMEQYQKFTWEEIVSATSSFSENQKIGMGAYGTVYKCHLHHTTAAVKVLHSKENHNTRQFQREIEILSSIRHPHLLILIGACPDNGCLVYEYMENGSLDERLLRVNNTPPIPWFERYRIAWEIASALAFLHSSKPRPIIHRDLKPANILLDRNFVSKIGDVGLSTMLHSDAFSVSTAYKDTGPVGTLCYMDPEYQRSGVISAKSDVYAFGMVILQLLTAKPAIALAHVVETAIEDGRLTEILDPEAGNWPFEETIELATLGLSCVEMRRKDRPDLKEQVLPLLERLKAVADRGRTAASSIHSAVSATPSHFICPILKDVINDPCVAADGYTYDRKAIEKWLEENEKSPMTNLPLPSKNLLPNYTLLSAIMEWKSKKQ